MRDALHDFNADITEILHPQREVWLCLIHRLKRLYGHMTRDCEEFFRTECDYPRHVLTLDFAPYSLKRQSLHRPLIPSSAETPLDCVNTEALVKNIIRQLRVRGIHPRDSRETQSLYMNLYEFYCLLQPDGTAAAVVDHTMIHDRGGRPHYVALIGIDSDMIARNIANGISSAAQEIQNFCHELGHVFAPALGKMITPDDHLHLPPSYQGTKIDPDYARRVEPYAEAMSHFIFLRFSRNAHLWEKMAWTRVRKGIGSFCSRTYYFEKMNTEIIRDLTAGRASPATKVAAMSASEMVQKTHDHARPHCGGKMLENANKTLATLKKLSQLTRSTRQQMAERQGPLSDEEHQALVDSVMADPTLWADEEFEIISRYTHARSQLQRPDLASLCLNDFESPPRQRPAEIMLSPQRVRAA